jgi:hypothetical protein
LSHFHGARAALLLLAGGFLLSIAGCASMVNGLLQAEDGDPYGPPSPQRPESAPYRTADQQSAPLDPDERAVVASAGTLIGMAPESRVVVNGRAFVLDCIGTVSAIFWGMDVDVQKDFRLYRGDGVSRLYQSLKARDVLHRDRFPRPGDVIFWDNTWDANGNGILGDDPLTHAGVVVSVDADGTIHYVHEHIIKGVTMEVMNLRRPRDYYDPLGRVINNAMAMNSGISRRRNPPHWTSGDLWDSFGDVLRVKKYFEVAVSIPGTDRRESVLVALRPPDPRR